MYTCTFISQSILLLSFIMNVILMHCFFNRSEKKFRLILVQVLSITIIDLQNSFRVGILCLAYR